MSDHFNKAKAAFERYATMDDPKLPTDPQQALQVRLARWQAKNFSGGPTGPIINALGVNEENGELGEAILALLTHSALQTAVGRAAHVILKSSQRIRGMEDADRCRSEIADALADIAVFSMQMATVYRLDYWQLVKSVAEEVLERNWKASNNDK